jgi:hypothetical protein
MFNSYVKLPEGTFNYMPTYWEPPLQHGPLYSLPLASHPDLKSRQDCRAGTLVPGT